MNPSFNGYPILKPAPKYASRRRDPLPPVTAFATYAEVV